MSVNGVWVLLKYAATHYQNILQPCEILFVQTVISVNCWLYCISIFIFILVRDDKYIWYLVKQTSMTALQGWNSYFKFVGVTALEKITVKEW